MRKKYEGINPLFKVDIPNEEPNPIFVSKQNTPEAKKVNVYEGRGLTPEERLKLERKAYELEKLMEK